jgi:hypothetical protein
LRHERRTRGSSHTVCEDRCVDGVMVATSTTLYTYNNLKNTVFCVVT